MFSQSRRQTPSTSQRFLGRLLLVLLASPAQGEAESTSTRPRTWNQWRGPSRDGIVDGPKWPTSLSETALKSLWHIELSQSYSSPIVSADRVFVTETREKKTEVVTALDRKSGKVLWKREWEGALSVPFFAKSNGDWIRSTPAFDGSSLYVAGMRDVLVCLDAATGAQKWRVDFTQQLKAPLPDFGYVSSPLVDQDAVYTQAGASVVKLDKSSGSILWRSMQDGGGMFGSAFSSPIIADLCGIRQLLVQSREKLAGLDLATGSVLWSRPIEAFRGMNILTPIVFKDHVLTSTYGGKTIAFKITREGSQFQSTEAWTHKAQGYMSTPVVINGVAYHHLKSQRVMALDLASGKELWTSDKSFGKYWSLVGHDDQILALDERGELFLVKANPNKFEIQAQRKVSEHETWAHLAVADDELFIRDLRGLRAWKWTETPSL